jgi:hypothetical protein
VADVATLAVRLGDHLRAGDPAGGGFVLPVEVVGEVD